MIYEYWEFLNIFIGWCLICDQMKESETINWSRLLEVILQFSHHMCVFHPFCSQREANSRPRQWNSHNQPSSVTALPGKHAPNSSWIYSSLEIQSSQNMSIHSCNFSYMWHFFMHITPVIFFSQPLLCIFLCGFDMLSTFIDPVCAFVHYRPSLWPEYVFVYTVQLGKMRLMIPCRALTCSHLQCFDATLYIQMNEKKPTWVCPVCDKKAPYEHLIIDG